MTSLQTVTIRYQPPTAGDHTVGIAADFTHWLIESLEYRQGIFQKKYNLAPGHYAYKLIIDGNWSVDPSNPLQEPDPYGGMNSVLQIQDTAVTDVESDSLYTDIAFDQSNDFPTPDWVKEGVIYQIFPDRFNNGNPANDPDFSEWYYEDCKTPPPPGVYLTPQQEYFHLVKDWYDVSTLKHSPYQPNGKPDWWSFYGGDIAGVLAKLDYLSDLGITIIYFNPLWQAKSNHKYDAADFKTIDPHFGTPQEFRSLVDVCHARGIRIILDVAFNHTGETFWAFRDCVEHGPDSKYWDWYDWFRWPLPRPLPPDFKPKQYYQCWWGVKDMPDLNYDLSRLHPAENEVKDIQEAIPNMPVVDHILSACDWWLTQMNIDGFRLDVPEEVPFWFWELFRARVKSHKPDAWLVGELWNNAREWVSPRYFDSVMNYAHFKDPVIDYFVLRSISKPNFLARLRQGLISYPQSAVLSMMNLLGSHDTWRLTEVAEGDFHRIRLAVLFQMTFPGCPHVYYGDEIAMRGGKDPDNRRPMNWHWQDQPHTTEHHRFYRHMIALRRLHKVWQTGSIRFLRHNDLLIYERTLQHITHRIIFNNTSTKVEYEPDVSYRSILYNHNVAQSIALTRSFVMLPYSCLIIELS